MTLYFHLVFACSNFTDFLFLFLFLFLILIEHTQQPFRVKMRAFLEKHAHPTLLHSATVFPDFLDSVVGASSLGDGRLEVVWVMADRRWVLMRGREQQR